MYSGVILKYRDKFLLCKRNENQSHANQWFIPTGKIERGETPREAAMKTAESKSATPATSRAPWRFAFDPSTCNAA